MKDDGLILAAWSEAVRQHSPAILATVVKVSGSAYRGPGARMLITETGVRTGSISGGCLEGDVLKKAWWLTGDHPAAVRVYDNSSEEDAIWEFGLGCNGIVHVLLERWPAGANPLTVELLEACRTGPVGGVLASFPLKKLDAAMLRVWLPGKHLAPAGSLLYLNGRATPIVIGYDGYVYIVDPPHHLAGTVITTAGHCKIDTDISITVRNALIGRPVTCAL